MTSLISNSTPSSSNVFLITFLNAFKENALEFVHNSSEPSGANTLKAPLTSEP